MTKNQIASCKDLIVQWNSLDNTKDKNVIRNNLFLIMQPFMEKWVSSILSRKGRYVSLEDIKSKSWICFEFCLKHFKINEPIPIPNHFYSYTRFCLAGIHAEQNLYEENTQNIAKINSIPEENILLVYEDIDELKCFRLSLPPEYVSVFDDAILSLVPRISNNLERSNISTLSYDKYRESKKIFKLIIRFLLMR